MKENRPKQGENGGKWRNSEAQRRAASVGVSEQESLQRGGEGLQSKDNNS